MAATASRDDPYNTFAFEVKIKGVTIAGFSDVTGLTIESDIETFREGGRNFCERQLPGPSKFSSRLTLKRGVGDITELWDWYHDVVRGIIDRRNIAIFMKSETGVRRRSWEFTKACPIKWSGPELHAGTSAIAFETLEFTHCGLTGDDPSA